MESPAYVHLHATLHVSNDQGIIAFPPVLVQMAPDPVLHARPPAGLFRSVCHITRQFAEQRISPGQLLLVRGNMAATLRMDDAIGFEVVDNDGSQIRLVRQGARGRSANAGRGRPQVISAQTREGESVLTENQAYSLNTMRCRDRTSSSGPWPRSLLPRLLRFSANSVIIERLRVLTWVGENQSWAVSCISRLSCQSQVGANWSSRILRAPIALGPTLSQAVEQLLAQVDA